MSVLVPVYNEAGGVGETVRELLQVLAVSGGPFEVIVIDDGSTDGTAERIPSGELVRVISHPVRMGYGRSLKDGIEAAKYPDIVIIDGDATYPAEAIPRLAGRLDSVVMAVGQRKSIYYHRMQFLKILSRKLLGLLTLAVTFRRIPDLNSGLRAFRKDWIAPHLGVLCDGFSFTSGMTVMAYLQAEAVHWEPIEYRFRKGDSKIRFLKDGVRLLRVICSVLWRFAPLRLIIPAVILAGLFLRLRGITWGFPYIYNADEPHFINLAVSFGSGDFNPHMFKYPTLWMYVLFAAYGAYYTLWSFFGLLRSVEDFGGHFVNDPGYFILIGRFLAAAFSCLALAVFAKIENLPEISGSGKTGLQFPWGLSLLAVAPILIISAHTAKPDCLMFFLACAAWFYALRIYSRGRGMDYFLSGLFAGLAFSAHYTALPVLMLVPLAHFLPVRKNASGVWHLFAGIAACAGGFVLGSPYAVLDFPAFMAGLKDQQAYMTMVSRDPLYNPWNTIVLTGRNLLMFAGPWSLAGAGVVIGLWRMGKREFRLLMLLILPVTVYTAFMLTKPDSTILRYYSACFIPLAVIASCGFDFLSRVFKLRCAVLAIAVAAYLPGIWISAGNNRMFLLPDTREAAVRWIEANIPEDSGILMGQLSDSPQVRMSRARAGELYRKNSAMGSRRSRYYELMLKFHPGGGYRIYRIMRPRISMPKLVKKSQSEGPYLEVSGGLDVLREKEIRYVVMTSYGARGSTDPHLKKFFRELFKEGRAVAKFLPDKKTVAGPGISIYEIPAVPSGGAP